LVPDERWGGLVGVYGGYVAALFADRAAQCAGGDYTLASLTVRFRAAVEDAPLRLFLDLPHQGRRTTTARMRIEQDGRSRAEASAVLLRYDGSAPAVRALAPPELEPPADYAVRPYVQGGLAFLANLDLRTPPRNLDPEATRAWVRLAAPRADLGLATPQAAACVLMDVLLPVLFASDDPPVFVPTLEFSYAFTPAVAQLDQQWCAGENRLDWVADDCCAEDATLREAATGRLLARQRQLRSVRRTLDQNPTPTADPTADLERTSS
jgi:hypothetical protein